MGVTELRGHHQIFPNKQEMMLEFSKYREKLTMEDTSEVDSVWFKKKNWIEIELGFKFLD